MDSTRPTYLTGPLAAVLGALLALSALFQGGCEGTSSGVDNPGLTVSFRDDAGNPARVSGNLEIYAADQNPALAPQPLRTLRVRNSSFAILVREDISQLVGASEVATRLAPSAKRVAGAAGSADPSTFRFNLVFRGDAHTGSLASGLAYDKGAASFGQEKEEKRGLQRLDMRPSPLRRVRATLSRGTVHGAEGLVYIPGTPFRATVTTEGFEFDGLPEGMFSLRLFGEGGHIFPIVEPMTIQGGQSDDIFYKFSASIEPIGRTDTSDTPSFSIRAVDPVEAAVGLPTPLLAVLQGMDSSDQRLSVRWRQLTFLPDTARISFATRLNAQALFLREGIYSFEVAATIAGHTARDTALVVARPRFAPTAIRVIAPNEGAALTNGLPFNITWDMPKQAFVRISISLDGGSWQPIEDSLPSSIGINSFSWIPRLVADSVMPAVIQVRTLPPDSLSGYSANFILKPGPVPIELRDIDSLRHDSLGGMK